ncbi:MAG: hypothetical protein ACI9V1_001675 [Spirosomataceae bacterium]|jgi:hypothetical protein
MKISVQNITPQKVEDLKTGLKKLGISNFELDFITNQLEVKPAKSNHLIKYTLPELLTRVGLKPQVESI